MSDDGRRRTRRSPAKEAKWREVIREWRASGETLPDFVATRGLSRWTVRWWCAELKRRDAEERPGRSEAFSEGPESTEEGLVPVRVVKVKARPGAGGGLDRRARVAGAEAEKEIRTGREASAIEVVPFGQIRIRVPVDFDPRTLRAVLDVLKAPC